MREIDRVPQFLRTLFEKETQELNEEQFAQFLTEFQDILSEEIIAKNYNVVEHTIKFLKDSNLIKQTPRRVPFYL